jgi:glycosyltransferase involved in cell wall biosynthesis
MKIAIDTLFENPDQPTGAIDYLRNVARVFPRIGPQHEFCFLVSKRGMRHFKEFEQANLRFIECASSNENLATRIIYQQVVLPLKVSSHKIDVLFSPGNVCPLVGNFCRVLKINTLHQYHTPELCGRTRTLYRKTFFGESARRADHVLANTELTKTEICKFMKVPEDKVTVIGEALYEVYSPVPMQDAQPIRAKYGLEQDYILFVSLLYPYKNVETLLKALGSLVESGKDLRLAIVGRDFEGHQAKLQALTSELDLSDRVKFLGFVPTEDLPAIYSSAQAFIFPSLVETFGKPLVEAMQCGAPIVASNVSCIPEVLGGAGVLVDPMNAEQMAAAIARVIEDPDLRKDLIERGLKRSQDFSWTRGAEATLSLIERTFEQWRMAPTRPQVVHGA